MLSHRDCLYRHIKLVVRDRLLFLFWSDFGSHDAHLGGMTCRLLSCNHLDKKNFLFLATQKLKHFFMIWSRSLISYPCKKSGVEVATTSRLLARNSVGKGDLLWLAFSYKSALCLDHLFYPMARLFY